MGDITLVTTGRIGKAAASWAAEVHTVGWGNAGTSSEIRIFARIWMPTGTTDLATLTLPFILWFPFCDRLPLHITEHVSQAVSHGYCRLTGKGGDIWSDPLPLHCALWHKRLLQQNTRQWSRTLEQITGIISYTILMFTSPRSGVFKILWKTLAALSTTLNKSSLAYVRNVPHETFHRWYQHSTTQIMLPWINPFYFQLHCDYARPE